MNRKLLPIAALALGLLATTAVLGLSQAEPNSSHYAGLSPTLSGGPEINRVSQFWSSGWITVTPGSVVTVQHDLGGNPHDYVVDMWYVDADALGLGINARAYGGLEIDGHYWGAAWQNLSSDAIEIYRYEDDGYADLIRVDVFQPEEVADYCSPWTPITQGHTLTFEHELGGDVDDLVAALEFSGTVGINRRAYGGLEDGGAYYGAYWSNLTTSTVQVTRHADDTFAEQVHVCVNQVDPPDYVGDWIDLTPGMTETIQHNSRWNPTLLRVRVDYRDTDGDYGINHYAAGGMAVSDTLVGVDWHHLTPMTIQITRKPQDVYADQARLRIWKMGWNIYLPVIQRNYALATELAHDDGNADSYQSQITLDSGFAVQFSTPSGTMQLITARYYLNTAADNHPIQVHVWDANHNALITQTVTPPAGEGWFDVDLSGLNLTVSGDFYVGFVYAEQHSDPSIGVDYNSTGHSYEVDGDYWEDLMDSEYMIRAVLVP